MLAEAKNLVANQVSEDALSQNARLLEGVLEDFGVKGEIINVRPGPVVTLYELEPAPGIKSSRVIGLADDIARSMSAISARVAVVQGRNAIGIELPNQRRETVFLRELLGSEDFEKTKHRLAIALGKTIGGEPIIVDLARMPHLLVAGTTGSGKSVAINTMILSLLYRLKPSECRLIMVDPKMLELSVYDGIPHLLTPVVTDPKKAVVALKWAVREMEDRYKKMSKLGVRNIEGFNARVAEAAAKGETLMRTVQTGYDRETGEAIYEHEPMDLAPLPFIVVIVDEMADLMMVAGKDIEGAIQRLAQMARAAGIHLIMATQRPSVDVITGTIKANFPTRISFQVTSKIDSRTILGEQGAEQLLGQGDMLYMAGGGRISRVHGPFVADGEVEKVVAHLKTQGQPEYLEAITSEDDLADAEDGEAPRRAAWTPRNPAISTTAPSPSCCATANARRATSSAAFRSAITKPPRWSSAWSRRASSARPIIPASAPFWSAAGSTAAPSISRPRDRAKPPDRQPCATFSACARSPMRSSSSSRPTESRSRLSLMPAAARASTLIVAWVMLAGWAIRLSTPPSDSASVKIRVASTKRRTRRRRRRSRSSAWRQSRFAAPWRRHGRGARAGRDNGRPQRKDAAAGTARSPRRPLLPLDARKQRPDAAQRQIGVEGGTRDAGDVGPVLQGPTSLCAAQITAPPTISEWPLRNFVMECTT